jgi:hypothetical protein
MEYELGIIFTRCMTATLSRQGLLVDSWSELSAPKQQNMDKSVIEAKFNSLVQSGLVFYDRGQKLIEYSDEGLKVLRY